jgi:hypothetical protein
LYEKKRLSEKSFGGICRQRMFLETPILLILLCKINKIGVSRNFILLLKAAKCKILMRHPKKCYSAVQAAK